MTTLLLRLAGPMQSWGTQSRFSYRDSGLEPSKSGVIGLLCAALGKPRDERAGDGWPSLAELAALRMGVRVDREGALRLDYHTAGGVHRRGEMYGVATVDGRAARAVVSHRYFLADADFLVGLEGDEPLLRRLDDALRRPVWPLCLGRKSFVPSVPVRLPDRPPEGPGLRAEELVEALRSYPWPEAAQSLRLVFDTAPGAGLDVRDDVPLSFALGERRFGSRAVTTTWIEREEGSR